MVKSVHGGHNRRIHFDQVRHGITEPGRCELHLAELVNENDVRRKAKRWKSDPLEFSDRDSISPDAWRSRKRLMGEGAPLAAERLDREPHASAALADLPGDESRERDVPLAQQLGGRCKAVVLPAPGRASISVSMRSLLEFAQVAQHELETLAVAPEVVRGVVV
jgi:hypothetical protein